MDDDRGLGAGHDEDLLRVAFFAGRLATAFSRGVGSPARLRAVAFLTAVVSPSSGGGGASTMASASSALALRASRAAIFRDPLVDGASPRVAASEAV